MIGKPRQSKASNALYEHVLTKNFEIIQTFLSQFHELFRKQDQFEAELTKIELRISLVQENDKKLEDLLEKSNDMYEKKMKSLKQFMLQKVKNSGQKIQTNAPQYHIDPEARHEVRRQMISECQKQAAQQKKYQEATSEQMKKLQNQLSNINQRINYLTALTTSLDEKFGASLQINSKSMNQNKTDLIIQIQNQTEEKLLQFGNHLHDQLTQLKKQYQAAEKNSNYRIQSFIENVHKYQETIKEKLSVQNFKQFLTTYKEDQDCIIKQITQNFANKKQTKKIFCLLDKRVLKLENSSTANESEENNNRSQSVSCHKKFKHSPLMNHKRQPRGSNEIESSMKIRRLSHRKFLQEKYL